MREREREIVRNKTRLNKKKNKNGESACSGARSIYINDGGYLFDWYGSPQRKSNAIEFDTST